MLYQLQNGPKIGRKKPASCSSSYRTPSSFHSAQRAVIFYVYKSNNFHYPMINRKMKFKRSDWLIWSLVSYGQKPISPTWLWPWYIFKRGNLTTCRRIGFWQKKVGIYVWFVYPHWIAKFIVNNRSDGTRYYYIDFFICLEVFSLWMS